MTEQQTSKKAVVTHKGWMLFCPIYLNLSEREPTVVARLSILEPLLTLASAVQGMVIGLCSLFHEDYEPGFYFKVTGELKCPKNI